MPPGQVPTPDSAASPQTWRAAACSIRIVALMTLSPWRLLIPRRAGDVARETAARIDPFTLRFRSEELERTFLRWYDRTTRPQIRLALVLGFSLYLAFYLLDLWALPDLAVPILWIRLSVVLVTGIVLRLTYSQGFLRWRRWMLDLTVLVLAGGLLGIMVLGGARAQLHLIGIILALLATHALFRLRFPDAVALSAVIIAAYNAQLFRFGNPEWWIVGNDNFFLVSAAVLGAFASYDIERFARRSFVHQRHSEEERRRSEELLDNVLPPAIASRLKNGEGVIADRYTDATVLFADIVGFTPLASRLEPEDVLDLLNRHFTEFDRITRDHGLQKIKTVGDAYMLAGGCPEAQEDHLERIADAAIAIRDAVRAAGEENSLAIDVRIGFATGPVVAGVIGETRLAYDLWGDTVNTASRMETSGPVGEIHVTEAVYRKLGDRYAFRAQGEIEIKGKGPMPTYILEGRAPMATFSEPAARDTGEHAAGVRATLGGIPAEVSPAGRLGN